MNYFIIGDEDAVLGFGMVGVPGRVAANGDQAGEALRDALNDKDNGIVIITEPVAGMIRPQVDRFIFNRSFPLIVEIPGKDGPLEGRLGLRDLVNKAIGINI